MAIGNISLAEAKAKLVRLAGGAAKIREQAEHAAGVAIGTVETAGTAGVLAYLRGRYPSDVTTTSATGVKTTKPGTDLLVAGVPVSLMVGLAGHIAGFTGMLGKYSDHGHAVGTGGLAEYASSMLLKIGQDAKTEADKGKTPAVVPPATKGYFSTANQGQGQFGVGQAFPQPYAGSYAGPIGRMF